MSFISQKGGLSRGIVFTGRVSSAGMAKAGSFFRVWGRRPFGELLFVYITCFRGRESPRVSRKDSTIWKKMVEKEISRRMKVCKSHEEGGGASGRKSSVREARRREGGKLPRFVFPPWFRGWGLRRSG